MTVAKFSFISDASGGDLFTVLSFTGHEAISSLYQYQIELRAPLSAAISLDDVLDSPARFVTELDGKEYPVYGMLSNFEELQTIQDYVHFKAVLVPRLWGLSIYKTNEIYTQEKTVDLIIETVLENAGLYAGSDYDLSGLAKGQLLSRDYVCQFGESDFDFISRLMENEGIFYYFDHSSGDAEKIIFINDMNYESITRPALIFDVTPSTSTQHDCIDAWSCRKQRLSGGVTVRDFNPDHPSVDIAGTTVIDRMSRGTDYSYGDNIQDEDEATYLSDIRAEESLCKKTRYYGEGNVTRLQAGYLFEMGMHPNENYNGIEYLAVEVNHEGQHLDMQISTGSTQAQPQYRNSFVAIEAAEQFRPARVTLKPRFYGTMTGFIYAESMTGRGVAEVDELGRYRVHLPFDRADGSKDSSDPNRKASTWIRMAQPYAGKDEGMCFPLEGGTEVLLTFINGDPDQPIISAALPNASTPSLLNSETAHVASIVTPGGMVTKSSGGSYSNKSIKMVNSENQASASTLGDLESERQLRRTFFGYGPQEKAGDSYLGHFMPPADFEVTYQEEIEYTVEEPVDPQDPNGATKTVTTTGFEQITGPIKSNADLFPFVKLNDYGQADDSPVFLTAIDEPNDDNAHIDRGTGPQYVHRVGSTFAYPQQERVYFCGTFHEDFHMDDVGVIGKKRVRDNNWLMTETVEDKEDNDPQGPNPEVFHFPKPGGDGTQPVDPLALTQDEETRFAPNRVRGVSEDKRWGDQMNYAWGRSFNWAGGPTMGGGDNGSFGVYNYGNGYTEDLIAFQGGTSETLKDASGNYLYRDHKDIWDYSDGWAPSEPFNIAKILTPVAIAVKTVIGMVTFPVGGVATLASSGLSCAFSLDPVIKSFLDSTDTLEPSTTAVGKTFGNTYSYHNGLAVDIREGNSISKTYGNMNEYVEGNSESVTDGDSVSSTMGMTSEAYMGNKYEFNLATTDALTVGVSTELKLSSDTSIHLGYKFDFFFGLGVDVKTGWKIEADEAGDLTKKKVKVEKNDVKVDAPTVKVESNDIATCKTLVQTRIDDLEVAIKKGVSVETVNGIKSIM